MPSFPDIPLLNQWTDNEELDAATMYARVDAMLNELATRVADSGWVTTGLTVAGSGGTLTSPLIRSIGNVMFVRGSIVIGTTIPVGADGNIAGSVQVAQIDDNAMWPSQAQNIGSYASGPLAVFTVGTTGAISIAATVPGADLSAARGISFSGSYAL